MNPLINRLFGVEYMVKPDLRRGELPSNREAYQTELKIAAPSMCEMIFLSLIGMMDTLMVSTLGTYAISAVGLTNQPRMILLAIFFAMNVGVTAVVARRKGEGRQEDARTALRQAMVMISLIAILIMILSVFVSEPLMRLAGAKSDTLGPATDYFRIICMGLLCNALTMAICAALRQKYGYTEYEGESVEFHPSGMMTFGLLGTKADKASKLAFDPDKRKRQAMFREVCDSFPQYAVFIGGTTSFDLAELKFNKYSAVMRYAREHGFTKDQVLFVGDDLGDGGNDSHIRLYGMDYIQITDYTKLPEKLHFLYAQP